MTQFEEGAVKGAHTEHATVFKGIPFAAPPVGENRWRAPQDVTPWEGVRDATQFAPSCLQKPMDGDEAPIYDNLSEDCLYLNVWQPRDDQEKHPVMVWIHGGGFVNGGGASEIYNGERFARDGVVLVSINYRLGRFGFFDHPALEGEAGPRGNFGLMDQKKALEWVQRNISRVGGDPNNVTVFGESAGGNSVLQLASQPESQALFQRAIVMSGGGRDLMNSAYPRTSADDDTGKPPRSAEAFGIEFAKSHGIKGRDADALSRLRTLPAEAIVGELNMMTLPGVRARQHDYVGGPFIDGQTVVAPVAERFERGQQAKVPLMIGTTDNDLGSMTADTKEALFARFGSIAEAVRAEYDPDGTRSLSDLARALGRDEKMSEPARFIARKALEHNQPTWFYRFGHVVREKRGDWNGAPHATDVPYAFDTLDTRFDPATLDDADRQAAADFHAYMVNFARAGDPNGNGLPTWPRMSAPDGPLLKMPAVDRPDALEKDPWTSALDLVERYVTRTDRRA
ncbi:carboxylesterase/lipase family protein [Larsenimonas salina]|uniref:carboxylesterase/lipase family protein n=1 Tax=Larsenimonas salina TaxID=1295565 RepID=UPI002072AC61|nr:carboxylesterase family protein [Larsenimonas salina]MCM5704523.1 carboxylesterase family protein [Larsenimonas salina]